TIEEKYTYCEDFPDELITEIVVNDSSLGKLSYDGLKRITSESRCGGKIDYIYSSDEDSKPSEIIHPEGDKTKRYYHEYSEDKTVETTHGNISTFSYDKSGKRLKSHSNINTSSNYKFNELDQVVEVTTEHSNTVKRKMDHSYSTLGTLQSTTDFFGEVKNIATDECGRPTKITYDKNNVTNSFSISYDKLSRPKRYTSTSDDNTLKIDILYNKKGLESERTFTLDDAVISKVEYQYNSSLRLTSKQSVSLYDTTDEEMTYDDYGRLITYACTGSRPVKDRFGNEVSSQAFSYDNLGNITKVYTAFHDGSDNTEEYKYSSDEPLLLEQVSNTHPDYPNETFKFDKAGNQLNDTIGNNYHYNANDQLVKVTSSDERLLSEYFYDAFGKQVKILEPGKSENYFYYENDMLTGEVKDNHEISYNHLNGLVIGHMSSFNNKTKPQLYLNDVMNTIIGTVSDKVDFRQYAPFGQEEELQLKFTQINDGEKYD
ncbi:RHS repeat domain-containing protein, partial [Photobacterium minamisatsumaniensis]|uniref:RHS repeat domain-containing protein n=1 Tax=Photobacterium minamisatsumaniensis TaxID=2910233 RepID=UPI003D121C2E